MEAAIGYLVISLLVFLISIPIVRWIFLVERGRKYQRANMKLLSEIAKKLGVDDSQVKAIQDELRK